MVSKRDKLGRKRHPNQDAALAVTRYDGRTSRSHNISASAETHQRFAALTPQERGEVIQRALDALTRD